MGGSSSSVLSFQFHGGLGSVTVLVSKAGGRYRAHGDGRAGGHAAHGAGGGGGGREGRGLLLDGAGSCCWGLAAQLEDSAVQSKVGEAPAHGAVRLASRWKGEGVEGEGGGQGQARGGKPDAVPCPRTLAAATWAAWATWETPDPPM